jgi:hypothetical protein
VTKPKYTASIGSCIADFGIAIASLHLQWPVSLRRVPYRPIGASVLFDDVESEMLDGGEDASRRVFDGY